MKAYKCSLYEIGWNVSYLIQREIILAVDEIQARKQICEQWGIRKNKKGLEIEEITFERVNKITRTKTELIKSTDYRCGLGVFDDSHYGEVTRYYCEKCENEVDIHDAFCKNCGGYLG
jgi:type II restriction/modification system DNA methylase subunit YeeA